MAADNVAKFRVYQDIWNDQKYTDENMLNKALLTAPDILSPIITHLAGREDQRFPLTYMTEGMNHMQYINSEEFEWNVIGRLTRAVRSVAGSLVGNGFGHSTFKLTFEKNDFVRQYLIFSPSGLQARIKEDPVEVLGGYQYTLQLVTTDDTDVVTAATAEGMDWVQAWAPVSMSGSRGNDSKTVAPSKMKSQLMTIRKSYQYEGNMPNKVVVFQFPVNGKLTNLWWDFEEWMHNLKWMEEVESAAWYSTYNRDASGIIHLKDDNGKPIPTAAGMLEQIPNYNTYSELTTRKLKDTVRDALYGASDASQMNIVMYTGLGGTEEFDRAMKDELAASGYIKNTDPASFVTGSGNSLTLGGFFTSYKHQDGHVISVRKLPLFDHGFRALNSPKHPRTGLPLESYRMVFLDHSTYEGQNNIYALAQTGRSMLRWAVAGATIPPGFTGNATRATDIDGASIHFLKTIGWAIRRATNCLHLECVAGI